MMAFRAVRDPGQTAGARPGRTGVRRSAPNRTRANQNEGEHALRIARACPDLYGTVAATGIAAWLAFQAFENIGMNLGIMPVTGLPLPFVSYGGSSMFAGWIAVGILQGIRLQRPLSA